MNLNKNFHIRTQDPARFEEFRPPPAGRRGNKPVLARGVTLRVDGPDDGNRSAAVRLSTVNRVVSEAVTTWDVADRVRRMALPSLLLDSTDLEHMDVAVAEDCDGTGIGIAAWEQAVAGDAPGGSRAVLLHSLYVMPRWQRRGVGASLLELAEQRGLAHGYDGMSVRAWRESEAFFLANGFDGFDRPGRLDTYPRRLWKWLR